MSSIFTYTIRDVAITSVTPAVGPAAGGTAVSIQGRGFATGIGVTFGGVAATSVVVATAELLTCMTPVHAVGAVDVVVTNTDTTTATLPGAFTYQAASPTFAFWYPAVSVSFGDATRVRRVNGITINQNFGQVETIQYTSEIEPVGESGIRVDALGVNLFTGTVTRTKGRYEEATRNKIFDVNGSGLIWQLTRRRPRGSWVNTDPATILSTIFAQYAPGFTLAIVNSLRKITIELTGTDPFDSALTRICNLTNSKWMLSGYTVYIFTISAGIDPPADVTDDNPDLLKTSAGQGAEVEWDYTQIRNVLIIEGAGDLRLEVSDAASVAKYGPREDSIKDNTLTTVGDLSLRATNFFNNYAERIPTIHYATRDMKSVVGKTVFVNLVSPAVVGTFFIHQVTIDQIDESSSCKPRFTVTATPPSVPPPPTFDSLMSQVISSSIDIARQSPKLTGDVVSDTGGKTVIPAASVTEEQLAGCISSTKMTATGVPPGPVGGLDKLVHFTVDAAGRVTAATTDPVPVIKTDGSEAYTGDQSMGGHKVTSVTDPTNPQDAATKAYVDAHTPTGVIKADGSVDFTADESMGGHKLTHVTDPVNPQDAATKAYVDSMNGAVVIGETPSGAVNGSNTHYTTALAYPAGTLRVFRNGLRLVGADFTETGSTTFDINVAPETGDLIRVDYGGTSATVLNADNLTSGHVPAARMPALTGDITSTIGTVATTLAASGVGAGSYGDASHVPQVTVDAKGRVTAAANVAISAGALVLLEQHTAAASATLDFTSWYSSSYDEYMIEFVGIIPASASIPRLRMSTDGGATYDATALYDWVLGFAFPVSSAGAVGAASASSMQFRDSNTTLATGGSWSGSIKLFNPGSAALRKLLLGELIWDDNSIGIVANKWGGVYKSITAVNAFRFDCSTGNITSGTVRVYGVAK